MRSLSRVRHALTSLPPCMSFPQAHYPYRPRFQSSTANSAGMQVGQVLAGARNSYRLIQLLDQGIHESIVFKAEVLPRAERVRAPEWVVVKSAAPDNESAKESLRREHNAYLIPGVASNPSFRAMIDAIAGSDNADAGTGACPSALVFEWMDCTLAHLPSERYRHNLVLAKAILDAVLSTCLTLEKEKLVNTGMAAVLVIVLIQLSDTDIKPDNILLSGIDTHRLLVKVGDLGLLRPEGFLPPSQPYAMRAPEVYQGLGCIHSSQIWALAATLFCWIKPGIFGTAGNTAVLFRASWCIAKLMRLFPGWVGPPIDHGVRRSEFKLAHALISESEPEIMRISTLKQEMQGVDMPSQLKDLLSLLFIVNPGERPSAAEVLASKEYLALG